MGTLTDTAALQECRVEFVARQQVNTDFFGRSSAVLCYSGAVLCVQYPRGGGLGYRRVSLSLTHFLLINCHDQS